MTLLLPLTSQEKNTRKRRDFSSSLLFFFSAPSPLPFFCPLTFRVLRGGPLSLSSRPPPSLLSLLGVFPLLRSLAQNCFMSCQPVQRRGKAVTRNVQTSRVKVRVVDGARMRSSNRKHKKVGVMKWERRRFAFRRTDFCK